jgi:hypothetical protein
VVYVNTARALMPAEGGRKMKNLTVLANIGDMAEKGNEYAERLLELSADPAGYFALSYECRGEKIPHIFELRAMKRAEFNSLPSADVKCWEQVTRSLYAETLNVRRWRDGLYIIDTGVYFENFS